jgi:hypothetical protein
MNICELNVNHYLYFILFKIYIYSYHFYKKKIFFNFPYVITIYDLLIKFLKIYQLIKK